MQARTKLFGKIGCWGGEVGVRKGGGGGGVIRIFPIPDKKKERKKKPRQYRKS